MIKKSLILIAAILAIHGVYALRANAQNVVHYQSNFAAGENKDWIAWANDNPTQKMEFVPDGGQGNAALRLTMNGQSWNTALVSFPQPIKITPKTVIRFNLKANYIEGMNISSQTTGARYFLKTMIPVPGDWFVVQNYLSNAVYKSGGKEGNTTNDVMSIVGNEITSMQISTMGSEVSISDFQIFEADQPITELPLQAALLEGNYQLQNYPILNTFFPYGVIYHGIADVISAGHFGQKPMDRYDTSLDDIKRHYMNTFSNFVDGSDIDERFKLAKKYNLRLFETRYAGVDLTTRPEAADLIKRFSQHESLLGWYSADEPSQAHYKDWVNNKIFINNIDKTHPVASAFSNLDAAKELGPYSEVVIVDPYTVSKSEKTINNLLWHANYLRAAKRYAAGKKVWFIAQSYGDREAMRYSTPEEIRFEVYNSLSAGVDGMLFFIHNDMPSYLEQHRQREKFDQTLVDPWFNGNATYEELSRLGRDVIPVMPSLMEKTEIEDTNGFTYDKKNLVFQAFKAKPGNLIVVVNKSLDERYRGTVGVSLERGQAVYDLVELAPVQSRSINLNLAPGDGGLYIVAQEAAWQALKKEISARKLKTELELVELDIQSLKTAKFNTANIEKILVNAKNAMTKSDLVIAEVNIKLAKTLRDTTENSNAEFVVQKKSLLEIRQSFGAAHKAILTRIAKLDGTTDPVWTGLFEQMKQYSQQYFELTRQHQSGGVKTGGVKTGGVKTANEVKELKTKVSAFQKTVEARIAELN